MTDGEAQIKRAAEEAAPGAQVVRSDGDLLVYYAGFNLSKFVRFLALQPYVGTGDVAQAVPSRDHVLLTVLAAYGFDTEKNTSWLRGTHAYSIATKVADALCAVSSTELK